MSILLGATAGRRPHASVLVYEDVDKNAILQRGQMASKLLDRENPAVERDAFNCCHCQAMIVIKKGATYGWCRMCGGPECNKPQCSSALSGCHPFEARLELWERRQKFHRQLGA